MPQDVCTTICSVHSIQSSSDGALFVAGRQRLGTVWRRVKPSLLVRLSVQCSGDGGVG